MRSLRVVLAVAAAGSTGRAGSVLHLTQPAVSRALLAVESALQTRLFERAPRGLVPTAAGERLVAGAGPLLVALEDLAARVREPSPMKTKIRVVCECYTAYHWLPTALARLEPSMPTLDVALAVEHTEDPIGGLASGDVDVALLTTAKVPAGVLTERPLFSDEVVFVVSASHPLAKKPTLHRDDLRRYPLVTSRAPPAETHWFMTRVFGKSRPRLQLEQLPLTEAIVDVTRAGRGIAILSEWIAGPHLASGNLVAKRLAAGRLERNWRFAYRRDLGDAANRLFGALEAAPPRHVLP